MLLKNRSAKPTAENVKVLTPIVGFENSKDLLQKLNCLNEIGRASDDLLIEAAPNITEREISLLRAAFALGSKAVKEKIPTYYKVETAKDVVKLLREEFRYENEEKAYVVLVDAELQVIGYEKISDGFVNGVFSVARQVYAPAIKHNATGVMLVHNHPSGDPSPSEQDLKLTQEYFHAGNSLSIQLLDSIIIGVQKKNRMPEYYSFKEAGFFKRDITIW